MPTPENLVIKPRPFLAGVFLEVLHTKLAQIWRGASILAFLLGVAALVDSGQNLARDRLRGLQVDAGGPADLRHALNSGLRVIPQPVGLHTTGQDHQAEARNHPIPKPVFFRLRLRFIDRRLCECHSPAVPLISE